MRKSQVEIVSSAIEGVRDSGRSCYPNFAELLQMRSEMLPSKDKALIQMYLSNVSSFGEMALFAGVSESTIARRVQRLTHRLLGGEYMKCLRRRGRLSRLEEAVARDHFLEGCSQKQIARKREFTVYQVRKAVRRLQSLIDSEVGRKDDDANL